VTPSPKKKNLPNTKKQIPPKKTNLPKTNLPGHCLLRKSRKARLLWPSLRRARARAHTHTHAGSSVMALSPPPVSAAGIRKTEECVWGEEYLPLRLLLLLLLLSLLRRLPLTAGLRGADDCSAHWDSGWQSILVAGHYGCVFGVGPLVGIGRGSPGAHSQKYAPQNSSTGEAPQVLRLLLLMCSLLILQAHILKVFSTKQFFVLCSGWLSPRCLQENSICVQEKVFYKVIFSFLVVVPMYLRLRCVLV